MKKLYIYLFITAATISACNKEGGKPAQLQNKQKELAAAKKEYSALKDKIAGLEIEISKLDGSDTIVKGKLVVASALSKTPFMHYIEEQGRVESDQNIDILAQFGGTIEQIMVKEGQRVSKGQALAQIEATAVASQINSLESQLSFAKTMYEKQKRLRAQNVGTEAQLLQAETQYNALRSQLQSVQSQYNNSRIVSPINGVVDAKYVKQGSMAAPGIPMFRIVGGSDNKVVANISESYITRVKNGLNVNVYFPDLNKELTGTISNVSQSIERASRTFQIQIKVSDKDIRPNMIAVVKIEDYKTAQTITVPVNTIQNTDEGSFVLVAATKGNVLVAAKKTVVKGVTYNGKTEILNGLQPGDMLITTGYQDLVEDQPIRLKK